MRRFIPLFALLTALACNGSDPANGSRDPDPPSLPPGEVPTWSYHIVNVFPHDTAAYTQGLIYVDGHFLEGTGGGVKLQSRNTLSSLRRVAIETGEVLQQVSLDSRFFGEGITLLGTRIYQLTWRERVGFIYRADTFDSLGSFSYASEGWGLTHDGARFIMSDGSAWLSFRDPETFAESGRLQVRHKDQAISRLNELEWVEGEVWANIYQTDIIARIDPTDGRVVGWIDLRGLLTSGERQLTDVLNGIAYDAATKRLFVTGKLWPWVFQIELLGRP
ncbi:MAG: glutaminyl-peptide cyclotransferase [bacterium]|nr:glutaminyl-peptide cyclotransferase [bacterium]